MFGVSKQYGDDIYSLGYVSETPLISAVVAAGHQSSSFQRIGRHETQRIIIINQKGVCTVKIK